MTTEEYESEYLNRCVVVRGPTVWNPVYGKVDRITRETIFNGPEVILVIGKHRLVFSEEEFRSHVTLL